MLTSTPQLLPQIVRPVEGDAKRSPSTLCKPHDMDPKPQIPPHSTSSCDDGEGQAEKRCSERLQATPKDKTESRKKPRARKAAPKRSQITVSTKTEENRRVVGWDENSAVTETLKHKAIRGCNQNMELSTDKDQMDSTTAESCDATKDKDSPKSPTAAKRWVIGPLLHSFKSKMTSFSEIVMSPVRLFKPSDLPPSDVTGREDGGALSLSQAADSSSESTHTQQDNVSKALQFDGIPHELRTAHEQTDTQGNSKVQVKRPEQEQEFASSRLTRGALLRGEMSAHPDPLKYRSNQSVCPGPCSDSNSSNNVSDCPTLRRRPHIRQAAQMKPASPKYAMNDAEDDPQDLKTNNLSDSSVFYTPPDSFSKDDGTEELEDNEESAPVVKITHVRSSPRKLSKSNTVTPALFTAKQAGSQTKVTGRKVTFDLKVEDDDELDIERQRSSGVSTDEEMNDDDDAPRQRQLKERKRTRKPLDTDPEWAGAEKRRIKAETGERATRRRGKSRNVAPKECLSEWLETSDEILYTRTTDREVTDSGTNVLLNSHEATAETEMSENNTSGVGLKFEGSNRLTRRQAKSKLPAPARVEVDPLEVEYSDCFTDCLAVSFQADNIKSHDDKNINGRDTEESIASSLSRKARQRVKKDATCNESTPVNSKTQLKWKEDDPSSVFLPDMENSSGSFLGTSTLANSSCKTVRSTKRRLMKKCHRMYGEDLADNSPSASILKMDNTISEMGIPGEKEKQEDQQPNSKDTSANETEKTPSISGRERALKRKSTSPSTEKSHMDDLENGEKDINAFMDMPVATASGSGSNRLLRSYSCPEIASLAHHDQLGRSPPLPPHGRAAPAPTPHHPTLHSPTPHLPPSPSKRARRHTVCSVEIEREIAPLCLRKEVYPTGRGGLYGSPSHPLCPGTASPSTSFTALVSSFLSSPLAFLSRRSDRGKRKACEDGGLITSSSLGPSVTLSFTNSSPPFPSSSAVYHSLAGFTSPPRSASVSPGCSHSQGSSEGEDDSGQQSEDGEENGTALGLGLLSGEMPVEKALSDSEIKMETQQGEQGKVSSIRIRRTLPKPLNNLTPMGLPKLIRPKKKEFSVEEIYTNKNFTKPAEGRLETIFEVPHKRRDGSHCLLGQKRVKRFVDFPEPGKVRKLRKPLVSAAAGSSTQKTSGQSSGGRPRRGAWSTFKDDPQLSPEDLDSLLCSKLDQLDSLMAADDR